MWIVLRGLISCVTFTGPKVPRYWVSIILRVSVSVFLGEKNIWIGRLLSLLWLGVIQSVEGLDETKWVVILQISKFLLAWLPSNWLLAFSRPWSGPETSAHLASLGLELSTVNSPTYWFTLQILGLVQFTCSVVSDSLRSPGLQYARLPCSSPTPGARSKSCPLSRWSHPTISSSVVPSSSCLQSFPASGSFLRSQFFTSGGWSIGASASALVLPMNIQDGFPLGWFDLLAVRGILKSLLSTPQLKSINSSALSFLYSPC